MGYGIWDMGLGFGIGTGLWQMGWDKWDWDWDMGGMGYGILPFPLIWVASIYTRVFETRVPFVEICI
jgi:hypothetical protein